jgi:transposase InsO family protein
VKSVEWLLWYSQAISSGRLEATAQLCGEYPANQSPDSAKTIWTYQDETLRRADGLSCRREHHSSGKGSQRSESKRTTIPDPQAARATDLVKRQFDPPAPNTLWVADFTYVSTWSWWVCVAFVIDAYSRRIVGWRCSTSMTTPLVLDAIEHAIWSRAHEGITDLGGLIHLGDRGSRYTSVAFIKRLLDAGIDASIGATGSSYDNALAETINGLYKTELIKPRGPWRNCDQVEIATMEWVDWFNNRRIYEHCDDLTPTEFEAAYYRHTETPQPAVLSKPISLRTPRGDSKTYTHPPGTFENLEDARDHLGEYVAWYNTTHKHSGIALFSPREVHDDSWRNAHRIRDLALQDYHQKHPERFRARPKTPSRAGIVRINHLPTKPSQTNPTDSTQLDIARYHRS